MTGSDQCKVHRFVSPARENPSQRGVARFPFEVELECMYRIRPMEVPFGDSAAHDASDDAARVGAARLANREQRMHRREELGQERTGSMLGPRGVVIVTRSLRQPSNWGFFGVVDDHD